MIFREIIQFTPLEDSFWITVPLRTNFGDLPKKYLTLYHVNNIK